MRVFVIHRRAGVPRELLPHFLRDARVGERRIEAVTERMERPLGELACALPFDDAQP